MSVRNAGRREFIAICAILMAMVALSVDIMLPALGDISDQLGFAEANHRQWVITTLFIGLTFGQLFFGPISDSIGRKAAILFGIVPFAAGSLICAFANSFEIMILGRLIQGFGAAGPRVVTIAMVRDRYQGAEMANVMSVIIGIFILVPVIAPMFGQALLVFMPWRGLFGALAAICLTGGVWLSLRQSETLAERKPYRFRRLFTAAREVFSDIRAMSFTLASACCYGAIMGYVNSSQQLFQDLFRTGNAYAFWFGVSGAFISGATLVNARLVRNFGMERICISAVSALIALSLTYLVLTTQAGLPVDLLVWMVFNCTSVFLLGLTFGNFNAIALNQLGHIAGMASAITASMNSAFSLMIAALIGLSFNMTTVPIAIGYALFGTMALGFMLTPSMLDSMRSKKGRSA